MYTKLTDNDFRRKLKLPENYNVADLLAYGIWDLYAEERHLPHLKKAFLDLNLTCDIKRFDNADIGHAYEFTIGDKNYWFVPVMGTAMMACYAHFANILGSKKNIIIGTVGGLAPNMKTSDFIIPTQILGNDNALKYQPDAIDKIFYPDRITTQRLKNRMPNDLKVWEGKTLTCESILAETEQDVSQWSKEGYLGVEMEGGLMFALSNYFKIPSAALFFVSDNLIEGETLLHESHNLSKERREKAREIQYRVAMEELIS
jgi:purine-nucleoside phosphorylase